MSISISYSTDLIESLSLDRNSSFNNFKATSSYGFYIYLQRYTFEVLPDPKDCNISYLLLKIGHLPHSYTFTP